VSFALSSISMIFEKLMLAHQNIRKSAPIEFKQRQPCYDQEHIMKIETFTTLNQRTKSSHVKHK